VTLHWLEASPFIAGLLILLAGIPIQSTIAERQAQRVRDSLGMPETPSDSEFASIEISDKISDGMDRMQAFAAVVTTIPALFLGFRFGQVALSYLSLVSLLWIIFVLLAPVRTVSFAKRLPVRVTWHLGTTALLLIGAIVIALSLPTAQQASVSLAP
jgi:hypothetical protein